MIGKIVDCITLIILTWLIYFIYVFVIHFLLSGNDLQNTINWFKESFFYLPIFLVNLLSDLSDQSNKSFVVLILIGNLLAYFFSYLFIKSIKKF